MLFTEFIQICAYSRRLGESPDVAKGGEILMIQYRHGHRFATNTFTRFWVDQGGIIYEKKKTKKTGSGVEVERA